MEAGDSPLPHSINPANFPAKLWRLVNNPSCEAICWDPLGELVVIDQPLFETQVLCPPTYPYDNPNAFKTTNFSSFVRQLNLYGFRKAERLVKQAGDCVRHCYYSPNFKRDHPELVAGLRRLTADIKAKMEAGVDVQRPRPRSKYHRFSGGEDVQRGSSSLLSPTHQESAHPYYPNKPLAMVVHNETPVPPHFLIRSHRVALSPAVYTPNKGITVSLSPFTGASSSDAVHLQQGLLACANSGSPNYNIARQPDYYSPVFFHQNLVGSHMTGRGLQAGQFSPDSYYQAGYSVSVVRHGENYQDVKSRDYQEVKIGDVSSDAIFQLADEMMQTPAGNRLVRVVTPDKSSPVLMPLSSSCKTVLFESPASTAVLSEPEQMPEDAIFELSPVIRDAQLAFPGGLFCNVAYSSCSLAN